jgi:hypothetical protein
MVAEVGRKRSSGFYSVYSVFGLFGAGIDFSMVCNCQNAQPWSHLVFIFNCVPTSQAGRRGFDPSLPLHKINNVQTKTKTPGSV